MDDYAVYNFLIAAADFKTGIYRGCALSIAYGFNSPKRKTLIQKVLRRLRDNKYVNFRKGNGARGPYDILVNKYDVQAGERAGQRLDAWKHGEQAIPDYVPADIAPPKRSRKINPPMNAAPLSAEYVPASEKIKQERSARFSEVQHQ